MLVSADISYRCVSVCPSVTSRCSTEMAKRRITQTKCHTIAQGLLFSGTKNLNKTQPQSPPVEAPNAGGVG